MGNQIFISYSHKDDKRWLEQLLLFLKPRERAGLIVPWTDTKIKPGQKWKEEIQKSLDAAKAAVLLVSANFLASDFITNAELPSLLAAAETKGVTILSVIISPCELPQSLSQFQAVNGPDKTLSEMNKAERERVWIKVAQAVEAATGDRPEQGSPAAHPAASSSAVAQPEQKPEDVNDKQSINVGRGLEIEDGQVGDIAVYKGTDASHAVKNIKDVSVMERGKIKNSTVGDIVFAKEESNPTED